MAQQVKNPSVRQETEKTWVWSLGQEDPLEEENGNPPTHSGILTWIIPWTEEPGGLVQRAIKSQIKQNN